MQLPESISWAIQMSISLQVNSGLDQTVSVLVFRGLLNVRTDFLGDMHP